MKKQILAEVLAVIFVTVIVMAVYATNASISASPSIPSNSRIITLHNPWVQKNATYRGALHCHSTNSLDGQVSPYNVSRAYLDQGFNFVAITDHNTLTSYTPIAGILALSGEEVSTSLVFPPTNYTNLSGHIVAINIKTMITPLITPQTAIDTINSQGGIAILAHPTSPIPSQFFSNETLKTLTNYSFMEITNSDAATAIKLYDKLLSSGKVIWAVGSDDSHTLSAVNQKGSVIVNANTLTIEDVISNLRAGNFYVTTGRGDPATPEDARISSITVSGLTITVKVPEASTIQWIMKNGVVAKPTTGVLQDSYTVRGDEKYVRVMTTLSSNENKHAWSQPILIDVS
jgi:predicted metal-dependent phosphoesterase TrpH